jgi:hypothetical protein
MRIWAFAHHYIPSDAKFIPLLSSELREPLFPVAPPGPSERKLRVIAACGEEKGRCITKAFARIFPPSPRTRFNILGAERRFAPLRGPSEFASRLRGKLPLQDVLPLATRAICQPHPNKMKQFMDENPAQFVWVAAQFDVESQASLSDIRCRVHGGAGTSVPQLAIGNPKLGPPLDPNRCALEGGKPFERLPYFGAGSVKYFSLLN